MEAAAIEVCELAKARGVRLLFDAEQSIVQAGIDAWTIDFQRRYNAATTGQALIYGTYQTYLRSTPATLARHLSAALDGRFILGVKLVRGAYLGSDPRHFFYSCKAETDAAYDQIAEGLIKREYNSLLRPLLNAEIFPMVNVVVASHNLDSVKRAMDVQKAQSIKHEGQDIVYGQLMGMADHVTCELIQAAKSQEMDGSGMSGQRKPKVYKYLVWGTVGECLKYLLRRAEENRDAITRSLEGHAALRAEVRRRIFGPART